jgi:hypothetical protein
MHGTIGSRRTPGWFFAHILHAIEQVICRVSVVVKRASQAMHVLCILIASCLARAARPLQRRVQYFSRPVLAVKV